jgi:molybdenum cofactor cytidylyltransferase
VNVRALVLAAGEGRRFGGAKQLALVRGRPLLAHVLDAAAPWEPLVVLGAHADAIRAEFPRADAVLCPDWAEGQAASLRTGVAALGDVDAAIVLLADMPGVTGAVIAGALEHLPGFDAVRTLYAGRPGHPVILGRTVLDAVGTLRGDTGARELLRSFKVHEWEAGHLADPTDIDTHDQLEALT